MKCFYHSADLDGKCSGAIVKMVHPECDLVGINYGEQFPFEIIEPDELVYLVDFSLPFDDMDWLNHIAHLVWIDHHKSAIEEAARRGFLACCAQVLEIGKAACELTWQHCFPGQQLPLSVFYLGRYDVWDHHNHPLALTFQYGMRQFDANPANTEFWKSLFFSNIDNIIDLGESILAYEQKQNEKYARATAFEVEFDGLRCIAINKGLTNSLLFSSVYDPEKHDAMLSFYRTASGWKCSLYADKPEVDVSAICFARGGGGHKGAAGFTCGSLPF